MRCQQEIMAALVEMQAEFGKSIRHYMEQMSQTAAEQADEATERLSTGTQEAATSVFKRSGGSWAALPAIAFDPTTPMRLAADGSPLVVGLNDDGDTCVMGLTSGGAWQAQGPCTVLANAASPLSLAVAPSGTVLVAYADATSGDSHVVQLAGGTAWESVGSSALLGQLSSCQLVAPSASLLALGCLGSSSQPSLLLYSGQAWSAASSVGLPSDVSLLRLAVTGSGTWVAAHASGSGAVGASRYLEQ